MRGREEEGGVVALMSGRDESHSYGKLQAATTQHNRINCNAMYPSDLL